MNYDELNVINVINVPCFWSVQDLTKRVYKEDWSRRTGNKPLFLTSVNLSVLKRGAGSDRLAMSYYNSRCGAKSP